MSLELTEDEMFFLANGGAIQAIGALRRRTGCNLNVAVRVIKETAEKAGIDIDKKPDDPEILKAECPFSYPEDDE